MLYPANDRQYDPRASRPELSILEAALSLAYIALEVPHISSIVMLPAFNQVRPRWVPARVTRAARSVVTSQIYPTAINPSRGEVNSGRLTPKNLEAAIRSLFHDGLIVVTDVIPHDILDRLNKKMINDAQKLYARKENSPFNYNPNDLQQDRPPTKKYFDSHIFLNPIATQFTSTALGPRPKWTFCSGNTAMPPTDEDPPISQPVHSDADFKHPSHPFAHVINVPLITMIPNGSTEIWLGTHKCTNLHMQEGQHGERASGRIKAEELEKR
ncbi:uncharacterized protein N7484_011755 [Penicillium longicatenatum]|uniref:uncharacterized protein n=1 Tax=Penicillium longicatenatum TaxID=1561947 RepID=UPI0025482038|nr:uncharacterized protein N7484_011755 [Penicillium longicatenatum]KAJ5631655.1 hypothetical protein N7484_011755 [Penicillium longicatenatum]